MASTTEATRHSPLQRYVPVGAIAALILGAVIVGVRFGGPAVVLWFAFSMLSGAILLFWESIRVAFDRDLVGDDSAFAVEDQARAALEEKKRVAVRALKDLEFEHSIQRISDEDYEMLRTRYRADAREAMEALDKGLGTYLTRAEEMIARAGERESSTESVPKNRRKPKSEPPPPVESPEEAPSVRSCASCKTANDTDAVFCKKCGARLGA